MVYIAYVQYNGISCKFNFVNELLIFLRSHFRDCWSYFIQLAMFLVNIFLVTLAVLISLWSPIWPLISIFVLFCVYRSALRSAVLGQIQTKPADCTGISAEPWHKQVTTHTKNRVIYTTSLACLSGYNLKSLTSWSYNRLWRNMAWGVDKGF